MVVLGVADMRRAVDFLTDFLVDAPQKAKEVFKVAAEFKEQKVKVGDQNAAIKSTAVQMVHHHRLLSAWMLVSFFADTIGGI